MEKLELSIIDLAYVIQNVLAVPAEDPVPVWRQDPVTGEWTIEWVIPDPHPLIGEGLEYESVADDSIGSLDVAVEALKQNRKPVELLLAGADLARHARAFSAISREPLAAELELRARDLTIAALSGLSG